MMPQARIYCSSLDPRDSESEGICLAAFIEFLISSTFGRTITIPSGSVFDCSSLHNIWPAFYQSFKKYIRMPNEYGYIPLEINFDQRHKAIDRHLVFLAVASYIDNTPLSLATRKSNPNEFNYNVCTPSEIESIRNSNLIENNRYETGEFLSVLQNSQYENSIRLLNDYSNRFKFANRFFIATNDSILQKYAEAVLSGASALKHLNSAMSEEISYVTLKMQSDVATSKQNRTSLLIKEAELYFPNTYKSFIRPVCKSVYHELQSSYISPSRGNNFEISDLIGIGLQEFNAVVSNIFPSKASNSGVWSRKISFNNYDRYENIKNFDWDIHFEYITGVSHVTLLKELRSSVDPGNYKRLILKIIEGVAKNISQLLTLEILEHNDREVTLNLQFGEKDITFVRKWGGNFISNLLAGIPTEHMGKIARAKKLERAIAEISIG